jgi:hypothetical protein
LAQFLAHRTPLLSPPQRNSQQSRPQRDRRSPYGSFLRVSQAPLAVARSISEIPLWPFSLRHTFCTLWQGREETQRTTTFATNSGTLSNGNLATASLAEGRTEPRPGLEPPNCRSRKMIYVIDSSVSFLRLAPWFCMVPGPYRSLPVPKGRSHFLGAVAARPRRSR